MEPCSELAYAIESAHGWCIGEYARAVSRARPESCAGVLPVNTGNCICVGSPAFNFAVGLGLGRPVSPAELDEVEHFFRSRGLPPRIDVTPFTHPHLMPALLERGYASSEYTAVLCFDLSKELASAPTVGDDVLIRWAEANECDAWVDVVVKCFFISDPGPERRANLAALFQASNLLKVVAICDGKVVGAAAEMLPEDRRIAVVFASAVLPAYRKRGIHSTMLRMRLERAHVAGCKLVAVSATPGSSSERNLIRCGFRPCYEKITYAGPM